MSAQMQAGPGHRFVRRPIYWESWALTLESDRRYRRIVSYVGAVFLALAVLFSLYKIEEKQKEEEVFNATRYAQLLAPKPPAPKAEEPPAPVKEEPVKPAPKAEIPPKAPAKAPTPVKQPEPKPVPDKTEVARKVAEKSGVLALRDQLSDLRDPNLNAINSNQPLITGALTSKGGAGASSGNPDAIAASARGGSGGIVGSPNGVSGGEGAGVGTRRTGAVSSSIGGSGTGAGGGGGVSGGRTLAELQQVFDRNKGGFNAIFGKAQRDNPDIGAGKIVVNLTIAPDGSVTSVSLVSSSFHDADLERRIIERIRLLNFGAKKVPPFNYPSYPINYIPG